MRPPWTSGSGAGSSGLRVELVPGEPAVGAEVELLQGRAAVGGDGGQRLDRGRVGQRPRGASGGLGGSRRLDPRRDPARDPLAGPGGAEQRGRVGCPPVGGDRPGQLVLRGRFGDGMDHLRQVAPAGDRLLDRVGDLAVRRVEQPADVVEQRRARLGGAVLVAVAVGEEEPLAGQRQAGVEEVALLGLGVAARVEPQRARWASERKGSPPRSRRGNSPSCSEPTKTWSKRPARSR